MAQIVVQGDSFIVQLTRWEKLLGLKRSLEFPLKAIAGVTVDSGVGAEPKGIRAPGTHAFGLMTLGTYYRDGQKNLWAIRKGVNAVVISLKDAEYHRLMVEVSDPNGIAELLNSRRMAG